MSEWLPLVLLLCFNMAFSAYTVYFAVKMTDQATFLSANMIIISLVIPGLTYTFEWTALFLVRISVSQIEDAVGNAMAAAEATEDNEHMARAGMALLQKFTQFQAGISPALFSFFFFNGLFVTYYAYVILAALMPTSMVVNLAIMLSKLVYLCFMLQNCYQKVQELPTHIR